MTRPLVSFCLKAYNQRTTIGAALDGAFAQTYRPLELVICDDGSTDGTWEVIRSRVWGVPQRDDFRIVLHRNASNLGNAKNWEMCGKVAHGELLVKADGDDISLPERTDRVVRAWLRDEKRACVISHAVRTLPGNRLMAGYSARRPLGAGMAWSRDCFDEGWPEIGEDCRRTYDDVIYAFRGLLRGTELVLPDALVRYRLGSGETSVIGETRRPYRRSQEALLAALPQKGRDLDAALANGWIGGARHQEEAKRLKMEAVQCRAFLDLFSETTGFGTRLKAFLAVRPTFNIRGQLVFALYLLPPRLADRLQCVVSELKSWLKGGT